MDVVHGEKLEREISRMIEKRSREEPNPDESEPSYAESARAHNAAREAERRALWADYHTEHAERLRRTMEPLVAFHEARAAALNPAAVNPRPRVETCSTATGRGDWSHDTEEMS